MPTGNELSNLITDLALIGKNPNETVVELGSGTGVFTEQILKKITSDAVFFSIEINPIFVEMTRKKCPKALVYEDSAVNIGKYLKINGRKGCDSIISGLPWAGFSEELQQELLNSILNSLKSGGKFVTFAYIHGQYLKAGERFKELLKKNFSKVEKSKIVWKNFPPAFVYDCTK